MILYQETIKDWTTKSNLRAVLNYTKSEKDEKLLGYVAVFRRHPLYKKEYTDKITISFNSEINVLTEIDIFLEVHGGISYSGNGCAIINYPLGSRGLTPGSWWFGFYNSYKNKIKYTDKKFMVLECEKLAHQISLIH